MKKYWFCEKPAILTEAEKAQRKFHPLLLVIFYLIFNSFLANHLSFFFLKYLRSFSEYAIVGALDIGYMCRLQILISLLYIIPFSLFLFFMRFIEKRSWTSMGIVKNKILKLYLFLVAILIVGGCVWIYFINSQNPDSGISTLLLTAKWVTQIISGFCYAIVAYGFLLISLTNRMSMKNAVIVVALIPLVGYVSEMIFIITSGFNIHPPDTGFWQIINWESLLLIRSTLSTITSILFMASCALLLLRTSHIWSVAMLALAGIFITGTESGFGLPYPYNNIVSIVLAAAILCAVLFWPKKTNEKQEGAGFVSQ